MILSLDAVKISKSSLYRVFSDSFNGDLSYDCNIDKSKLSSSGGMYWVSPFVTLLLPLDETIHTRYTRYHIQRLENVAKKNLNVTLNPLIYYVPEKRLGLP